MKEAGFDGDNAVSSLLDNLDAAKAKPGAPKALHEDD